MTKQKLPLHPSKRLSNKEFSGAAAAVALERSDEQEIILRFLNAELSWGSKVKEVRMDFDLAEQLQRLLTEELEMVSN